MKNIKKLITTLLLIPALIVPTFAATVEDVVLDNKEVVTENKISDKDDSLDNKIEDIKEVENSEDNSSPNEFLSLSPWAVNDLNEVQFMGLFPIERFLDGSDFRKVATLADANTVFKLSKEKLSSAGIDTGNFTFKDTTRLEILKSISSLIKDEYSIEKLKNQKVFMGSSGEKYLNSKIPLEEMLALYRRAVNQKLQKENQTSEGFFYEVKNNKNTVYMLGSVHVGGPKMYPLNKEITDALIKSSKIYMEIDLTKEEAAKVVQDKSYYKDNSTLKDDLGEELYKRVVNIFESYGIPESSIEKMRPWALYNNLSSDPSKSALAASYGIESYFISQALLNKIPIDQLETVEYQSNVLSEFDKETYIEMIKNIVPEIEKNGYTNLNKSMDGLLNAWVEGNDKKLIFYIDGGSSAEKEFTNALTFERDKNMAKKIDKLLKQDGENTYFVLVGSAHLVPENSVTGILKEMGYDVNRKNFK